MLISGSDMFTEYITQKMKGEFEADSYGGNEATYLGMGSTKANEASLTVSLWIRTIARARLIILEFLTNERGRRKNR